MIALYTDFGWRGFYVGQMHAVLARQAPQSAVVDLMHDAPRFDPAAAGHLLAALVEYLPKNSIVVGVVDPGVGTERAAVALCADGRWCVGPHNGLFDQVAARASRVEWWRIDAPEHDTSATFHGRDVFAPAAAALARGEPVPGERLEVPAAAATEYAGVIYVDDFGNAMTGLHAGPGASRALRVGARHLRRVRTFADAPAAEPVWLENSIGLAEIVVNQGSAADQLGLTPGTPVEWIQGGQDGDAGN